MELISKGSGTERSGPRWPDPQQSRRGVRPRCRPVIQLIARTVRADEVTVAGHSSIHGTSGTVPIPGRRRGRQQWTSQGTSV